MILLTKELLRDRIITAGLFLIEKNKIILGYSDGNVKILNCKKDGSDISIDHSFRISRSDRVKTIAQYGSESVIFIGSQNFGSYTLYDLDKKEILKEDLGINSKRNRIFTSAWINKNDIVIGSTYGKITHFILNDNYSNIEERYLGEHDTDSIFAISFLLDRKLISGGYGGYSNIWNLDEGSISYEEKIIGLRETIQSIAILEEGNYFATLGREGTIQIFEKVNEDWILILRFLSGSGQGNFMQFSKNQDKLFALTENEVILTDIKTTGVYRYPIRNGLALYEKDKQLIVITSSGIFEIDIKEPDQTLFDTYEYLKVGVIGHTDTGKTTICKRIITGEVDPKIKSTKMKRVWDWITKQNSYRIIFHDFGGQASIIPAHLPHIVDSDLIIIVYSQRDDTTFKIATDLENRLRNEFDYHKEIIFIQTHGDHRDSVKELLKTYNSENPDRKIIPIKTKFNEDESEIENIDIVQNEILKKLEKIKSKLQINTHETNYLLNLIEDYQQNGIEVINFDEIFDEIKSKFPKTKRNYLLYTLKGLQIQGRIEINKRDDDYFIYLNMRKILEAKNEILDKIYSKLGVINWIKYKSELNPEDLEFDIEYIDITKDMLVEDNTFLEHYDQIIILDFLREKLEDEDLRKANELGLIFTDEKLSKEIVIDKQYLPDFDEWIPTLLDLNLVVSSLKRKGGILYLPTQSAFCLIEFKDPEHILDKKAKIIIFTDGRFKETLLERIIESINSIIEIKKKEHEQKLQNKNQKQNDTTKKPKKKLDAKKTVSVKRKKESEKNKVIKKTDIKNDDIEHLDSLLLVYSSDDLEIANTIDSEIFEKSSFNLERKELVINNDLIEIIESGISHFQYVILILTENFLKMEWKKTELDYINNSKETLGKFGCIQILSENPEILQYQESLKEIPRIKIESQEDIGNLDINQINELMIDSYQLADSKYPEELLEFDSINEENLKKLGGEIKILLLTATQIERDTILKLMEPLDDFDFILKGPIYHNTYYLGKLGIHKVVLLMTGKGSLKSILPMYDAIKLWIPKVVIMSGIAFGVKDEGMNLGDIIISEKIIQYEPEKKDKKSIPRGAIAECSSILLDRFVNALNWKFKLKDQMYSKIIPGPILSGEKLINDEKFLSEQLEKFPEAVGGEMEGAGLYEISKRIKTEWIIIKGICDWATRKSDKFQSLAARASASLVQFVLNDPNSLEFINKEPSI